MPMDRKHIFLSSVFDERTLHFRAIFRNEISARLNFIAGKQGENIYLYDYVMGIPSQFADEDQSEYATRVLFTCFDKIRKSQYFIFILGKQYGTVITDPQKGLLRGAAKYIYDDEFSDIVSEGIRESSSVLELELITAISTDGLRCIFCVDTDENTASSGSQINKLRQIIRQEGRKPGNRLIEYSSSDKDLQGLKNKIISVFEEMYDDSVPENELNPEERNQAANQNLFFANKSRYYVRNDIGCDLLSRYVTDYSRQCLCLYGVSGSGKSSLIANWSRDFPLLKEMNLVSFYAGTQGGSLFEMLYQVYSSQDFLNESGGRESGEEELLGMFFDFLTSLSIKNRRTVILIDGINQLYTKSEYDKYGWLPDVLPANVKLIFSTSEIVLLSQRKFLFYEAPKIDLLKIVEYTFLLEGKENEYRRLIREDDFRFSFNDIGNPMIARLFCQEVIMSLGFDDMKLHRSNEDRNIKLLADYLSILSDSGCPEIDKIRKLYTEFLKRLDDHFGVHLFWPMLSFIFCSCDGFTIEELAGFCRDNESTSLECQDTIREIYYTMYHEFRHDADRRILFYHEYIKDAIEAVVQKKDLDKCKKTIIDACFTRYNVSEAALFELARQLCNLEDSAERHTKTSSLFEDYYAAIDLYEKNITLLLECLSAVENKQILIDSWKPSYVGGTLDKELFLCGRIAETLGFYKKALEWYFQFLITRDETSGRYIDFVEIFSSITTAYRSQGEYAKALEWSWKTLDIREKVLGKEHPDTAAAYINIAAIYNSQGEYLKALEWYQKTLDIREKLSANDYPETAAAYNNIAAVYDNMGEYPEALGWYQKALAIFERVLGREHPTTSITYNNIAHVYDCQGDYVNALEWFRKAIAIREKVLGKEHPDTATTYHNIAHVYDNQGEYAKALEWYQKALTIREKALSSEYPSTAATYHNIGLVYSNQGEYPEALEWYQKALSIREKALGREHPDTVTTYDNIMVVYAAQGEFPKALEGFKRVISIREKVLGREHPTTANTYNSIASVYDQQGDYPKALEWCQKALTIFEKALGREHPTTAVTYSNIGHIFECQGDYPKAVEWYQKAITIREKILGKEHPDTASAYGSIAGACFKQGDYPKAVEWYQKSLPVFEKILGMEHPATVNIYNAIAHACLNQGDYPKAVEWYRKASAIIEKILGMEHPVTATTYSNIAGACFKQGEYAMAAEWALKAFAICEKALGRDHPETAAICNNIAVFYDKQGETVKSLEWYKKALAIAEKVEGNDRPEAATVYSNIAGYHNDQGEYPEALEWYKKALAVRERVLGKAHPDTIVSYSNIADVYIKQGEYTMALEEFQSVLPVFEEELGKDHPKTAIIYANIAAVYLNLGEDQKAQEWLRKTER